MSGNESFAALSASLTLRLDMFATRAIAFCDRPDALCLRASLVLILLAMLYPLVSAEWTVVTYQGMVPIGISAVSKRAIPH